MAQAIRHTPAARRVDTGRLPDDHHAHATTERRLPKVAAAACGNRSLAEIVAPASLADNPSLWHPVPQLPNCPRIRPRNCLCSCS